MKNIENDNEILRNKHKKRLYCSEKPAVQIIKDYYNRYLSVENKKEKILIKKELSIITNKSVKQIERYFKELSTSKDIKIKRGYGRRIPLNKNDCYILIKSIFNGEKLDDINRKMSMSRSKLKRLLDCLYIPKCIYFDDKYIIVKMIKNNKDDEYLLVKFIISNSVDKDIIKLKEGELLIELCNEIKDLFEVFEIKKIISGTDDTQNYYIEKVKKVLINFKIIDEDNNGILERRDGKVCLLDLCNLIFETNKIV